MAVHLRHRQVQEPALVLRREERGAALRHRDGFIGERGFQRIGIVGLDQGERFRAMAGSVGDRPHQGERCAPARQWRDGGVRAVRMRNPPAPQCERSGDDLGADLRRLI